MHTTVSPSKEDLALLEEAEKTEKEEKAKKEKEEKEKAEKKKDKKDAGHGEQNQRYAQGRD